MAHSRSAHLERLAERTGGLTFAAAGGGTGAETGAYRAGLGAWFNAWHPYLSVILRALETLGGVTWQPPARLRGLVWTGALQDYPGVGQVPWVAQADEARVERAHHILRSREVALGSGAASPYDWSPLSGAVSDRWRPGSRVLGILAPYGVSFSAASDGSPFALDILPHAAGPGIVTVTVGELQAFGRMLAEHFSAVSGAVWIMLPFSWIVANCVHVPTESEPLPLPDWLHAPGIAQVASGVWLACGDATVTTTIHALCAALGLTGLEAELFSAWPAMAGGADA